MLPGSPIALASVSHVTTIRHEPVDVLVIGAGPSGAIVAHTLATRGFGVLVLEQGDWVNPSDFPANHPEWELLSQQPLAPRPERPPPAGRLPARRRRTPTWSP